MANAVVNGSEHDPADPATRAHRGHRLVRRTTTLLIASDPGLNRLRMATSGAVCVGVALAVEFFFANAIGATGMAVVIFMMFGGLVGMIGSNALAGHEIWANVRAAAFFPVALGLGLLAGIAVNWSLPLTLAAFVVIMFVAVYVRRFGLNFFFYGFLIWIGFFLAAFVHVTLGQLGPMMLAIVVATLVVLALCITVFRPHPRRTLQRIFRSIDARSRSVAHACAVLLEARPGSRDELTARRRLVRARAQVRDAALMSDGWAAHTPALPPGWTAPALRRVLLEAQLNLDRLTAAVTTVARSENSVRTRATALIRSYADRDDHEALAGCAALLTATPPGSPADEASLRHVAGSIAALARTHPTPEDPPHHDDYEAATNLPLGQLPGAPSVASDVPARGATWNPLARLRFTTRQAIQVSLAGALAIIAGSALSEQRYYWAAITAFVAFTGTGTRVDTARKAIARVVGTLIGLIAGIALASLTSGHLIWALGVIIASIFFGYYLVRISYAYMIFFITIMISQLYSILGEFSDALLVLRLEETIIGAVIGIGVALVITPLSARDTIAYTERELLDAVAAVVEAAGRRLSDPTSRSRSQLDQLLFAADNSLRRLDLVTTPFTHSPLWERRPRTVRRRILVLTACVSTARELVALPEVVQPTAAHDTQSYATLAEKVRSTLDSASRREPDDHDPLPVLVDTTEIHTIGGYGDVPGARELGRLNDLVSELSS